MRSAPGLQADAVVLPWRSRVRKWHPSGQEAEESVRALRIDAVVDGRVLDFEDVAVSRGSRPMALPEDEGQDSPPKELGLLMPPGGTHLTWSDRQSCENRYSFFPSLLYILLLNLWRGRGWDKGGERRWKDCEWLGKDAQVLGKKLKGEEGRRGRQMSRFCKWEDLVQSESWNRGWRKSGEGPFLC